MELEHSFTVPVPPEQAWAVLLDVEQVAPCMPGATIDSVDGDVITGKIKVKVGPVALTYSGKAQFTEKDEQNHAVVLEASGKETRGSGTASATVHSSLQDEGGQTRVAVHTAHDRDRAARAVRPGRHRRGGRQDHRQVRHQPGRSAGVGGTRPPAGPPPARAPPARADPRRRRALRPARPPWQRPHPGRGRGRGSELGERQPIPRRRRSRS